MDKNPAAALARFDSEPKDAENRFLVGRANLLMGKYLAARKAFVEAQDRIKAKDVDPSNEWTIQTEIAIALTVLDDPEAQLQLKPQLENLKTPANAANAPAATTKPTTNASTR